MPLPHLSLIFLHNSLHCEELELKFLGVGIGEGGGGGASPLHRYQGSRLLVGRIHVCSLN